MRHAQTRFDSDPLTELPQFRDGVSAIVSGAASQFSAHMGRHDPLQTPTGEDASRATRRLVVSDALTSAQVYVFVRLVNWPFLLVF